MSNQPRRSPYCFEGPVPVIPLDELGTPEVMQANAKKDGPIALIIEGLELLIKKTGSPELAKELAIKAIEEQVK